MMTNNELNMNILMMNGEIEILFIFDNIGLENDQIWRIRWKILNLKKFKIIISLLQCIVE